MARLRLSKNKHILSRSGLENSALHLEHLSLSVLWLSRCRVRWSLLLKEAPHSALGHVCGLSIVMASRYFVTPQESEQWRWGTDSARVGIGPVLSYVGVRAATVTGTQEIHADDKRCYQCFNYQRLPILI